MIVGTGHGSLSFVHGPDVYSSLLVGTRGTGIAKTGKKDRSGVSRQGLGSVEGELSHLPGSEPADGDEGNPWTRARDWGRISLSHNGPAPPFVTRKASSYCGGGRC